MSYCALDATNLDERRVDWSAVGKRAHVAHFVWACIVAKLKPAQIPTPDIFHGSRVTAMNHAAQEKGPAGL